MVHMWNFRECLTKATSAAKAHIPDGATLNTAGHDSCPNRKRLGRWFRKRREMTVMTRASGASYDIQANRLVGYLHLLWVVA
jgi:hypothetical protein